MLKAAMAGRVNDGDLCRKETILPILLSNPNLLVPDAQAYKSWIIVGIDLGVPTQQLQRIKTSAKANGNGTGLLHGIVAELIEEWLKELDRKGERGSVHDLVFTLRRNRLEAFGEAIESALLPSSSSLSSAPSFAEVSSSGIKLQNPNSNYGLGSSPYASSVAVGTHSEGQRRSCNSNFAARTRRSESEGIKIKQSATQFVSESNTNAYESVVPPPLLSTSTVSSTPFVIIQDEARVVQKQERASTSTNGNVSVSSNGVRQWLRGISPVSSASSFSSSFSYVSVNYDNDSDQNQGNETFLSSEWPGSSSSQWNDEDNYHPGYQQQQQQRFVFEEERKFLPDRSPQQHQSRTLLQREMEKLQEAVRNRNSESFEQQSSFHNRRRSRKDSYSTRGRDKRKYYDDYYWDSHYERTKRHRNSSLHRLHIHSSRSGNARNSNERRKTSKSSYERESYDSEARSAQRSITPTPEVCVQQQHTNYGLNNLHLAVQANRISDVIKLIEEGADVNEPVSEDRCRTALHLAVSFIRDRDDAIEMIKLLMKNGANPYATNERGYLFMFGLLNKTQFEPITSHQFHDLVKFLIFHGHSKFLMIPTRHNFSVIQMAMKNGILETETAREVSLRRIKSHFNSALPRRN